MADYTENYNLKKPASEDFVDIADINGNMDKIDEALQACKNEAGACYCVCNTAAATREKVATVIRGNFKLEAGVAVDVKFSEDNKIVMPSLNVNGTGAKSIKMYSIIGAESYMWQAGAVVRFVYDGQYWLMQNGTTASTTYYGVTKLSSSTSSTSTTMAATPSAVKQAYDLANAAVSKSQKGAANGVAELDINGKVPMSQIPEEVALADHIHEVATTTKDGFMTSAQVNQLNNAAKNDLSNVSSDELKTAVQNSGFVAAPPIINFTRTPTEDYGDYAVYVGTYGNGTNADIPNRFGAIVDVINPYRKDAVLKLNGIVYIIQKRDALDMSKKHSTATTIGNDIYPNQINTFFLPVNEVFYLTTSTTYNGRPIVVMDNEITTEIPGLDIDLLPGNELQKEHAALLRLYGDFGGTFLIYGEHNPPCVYGIFTGDGNDTQTVDLGFTPGLVRLKYLYIDSDNKYRMETQTSASHMELSVGAGVNILYPISSSSSSNTPLLEIVTNGFKAYLNSGSMQRPNTTGRKFIFWAWK